MRLIPNKNTRYFLSFAYMLTNAARLKICEFCPRRKYLGLVGFVFVN